MPIYKTDARTHEKVTLHEGRVVKVRTYNANRNLSDTLDYSDWQTVAVTEALVYVGRETKEWSYETHAYKSRPAKVDERFAWEDCSNLFGWRGSDHLHAEVDENAMSDRELASDFAEWERDREERAAAEAIRRREFEEAEKTRKEEIERNRPVKGKRMEVFKGRKVPVGTSGTVAWISNSGNVLLKPDNVWQDRKADGVWVPAGNLRAR